MKKSKSHFRFNKQERSGIFFLLSIIFLVQLGSYLIRSVNFDVEEDRLSLNKNEQIRLDSLMIAKKVEKEAGFRSFNPNYISDYSGYVLGMSPEEIDLLHEYRASGAFIQSAEQFKRVTQMNDSLFAALAPHFQFPKWKSKKNNEIVKAESGRRQQDIIPESKRDLNMATAEDLKRIYGVGEILSARIVKFRKSLGGFLADEQLYDVYGLDSTVVERVLRRYRINLIPEIHPININTASQYQLSQNIYISRALAEEIIQFRDSIGMFHSMNQLTKIQDFPSDKIERIKLYLTL